MFQEVVLKDLLFKEAGTRDQKLFQKLLDAISRPSNKISILKRRLQTNNFGRCDVVDQDII